jgi:hypothetical protein
MEPQYSPESGDCRPTAITQDRTPVLIWIYATIAFGNYCATYGGSDGCVGLEFCSKCEHLSPRLYIICSM